MTQFPGLTAVLNLLLVRRLLKAVQQLADAEIVHRRAEIDRRQMAFAIGIEVELRHQAARHVDFLAQALHLVGLQSFIELRVIQAVDGEAGRFDGTNLASVAALEPDYRRLWSSLRATSDLGAQMFSGYARFRPASAERLKVTSQTTSVHEKPAIDAPDDWQALVTRLRVVMEDPRQLLSGAVTDYASKQLIDHGNDPAAVTVPGLDGEPYPHLDEELT